MTRPPICCDCVNMRPSNPPGSVALVQNYGSVAIAPRPLEEMPKKVGRAVLSRKLECAMRWKSLSAAGIAQIDAGGGRPNQAGPNSAPTAFDRRSQRSASSERGVNSTSSRLISGRLSPASPAARQCRTCCLRANENSRPLRCLVFRGSIPHPMPSLCTLHDRCCRSSPSSLETS
jgi:hypothetical protein